MEPIIQCVAVDDEAPALKVLEQYIAQSPQLSLAAQFRNPIKAAQWMKENAVQILFLDIQMPQQSGMDMLRDLPNKPVTIFTTAYSEFAADAFDLDAADYLRKPFSYQRFLKSIEKAKDYLYAKTQPEAAAINMRSNEPFITIKVDNRLIKIYLHEILFIEGYQEYIKIFTTKERFVTYERMKNMEAILPPEQFMRVHKSYIVNLRQVRATFGNMLEILDHHIPISRELKEQVMKRLL